MYSGSVPPLAFHTERRQIGQEKHSLRVGIPKGARRGRRIYIDWHNCRLAPQTLISKLFKISKFMLECGLSGDSLISI